MKTVRKFSTFEEMKASESKTINNVESLKKHKSFEKDIKAIRAAKTRQMDRSKSKWSVIKDRYVNSLMTICKVLQKYDVQYMLVGGAAVGLHGYFRMSKSNSGEITDKPDIDIWYNPTYENYFNLLKAIEAMGGKVEELKNEVNPDPLRSFLRFEFHDYTLDFLPQIKASIRFRDAYKRKETITIQDTCIQIIAFADLAKDKSTKARKKDIEDLEELKKRKGGWCPVDVACLSIAGAL